jgi:hypothetical protein
LPLHQRRHAPTQHLWTSIPGPRYFKGSTRPRRDDNSAFAVRIDLNAPGISFTTTPQSRAVPCRRHRSPCRRSKLSSSEVLPATAAATEGAIRAITPLSPIAEEVFAAPLCLPLDSAVQARFDCIIRATFFRSLGKRGVGMGGHPHGSRHVPGSGDHPPFDKGRLGSGDHPSFGQIMFVTARIRSATWKVAMSPCGSGERPL